MDQGQKQSNRRLSNIIRSIVLFLIIAFSFMFNIFGTTKLVLAVSCDSNASTEAACETLWAADDCSDSSGNVGAMWISETSGGDSETINTSQTSGNITAYLRGAFVSDGCSGNSLSANRIQVQYGYGKFQSKGTEIPYITGEGGEELDRGTSAGGYGDWSDSSDSIAVTINLDSLRADTDHVSFNDGVYVLKGSIYRCPVGVDESSDTCWGDPFRIRIKIPTKYRSRTYHYYKNYTVANADSRTVTNTQYYSATSSATVASNATTPSSNGATNTVPTSGTATASNNTATLTMYDRNRRKANIAFAEDITKKAVANDSFTASKDATAHPFNTRASGSILIEPDYAASNTVDTAETGFTATGQKSGIVYKSNHDYNVAPMNEDAYLEKCQTLSYTPSITYTGTQNRDETRRRYYTKTIVEIDTNGDGSADRTVGSAPGSGTVIQYTSAWSSWTTTRLSSSGPTQTNSSYSAASSETYHVSWGGWKSPSWTSAVRADRSGTSVTSCARIYHPYVYWQTEYTIDGAQNSSSTSGDDSTKTASVDNQWNKTTGVPTGANQAGQNLFVRSNSFSLSYTSFLKQSDATKPLTSLTGRTKAGSSTTDYLNVATSYGENKLQQADALYVNYSYDNSAGRSSPNGVNGKTDGGTNYRRAIYGISTNTNYKLNSSSTGYASTDAIYGDNRIKKTEATTVPGSEFVEIVQHYSNFSASNTNTWPATSNGATARGKIHYRITGSGEGISDNASISLKKTDASHNSLQFGPFSTIDAGDYVVYYSGTRLQDCMFDYTTDGGTNAVQASNIRLAHNGTVAAFNMHIARRATNTLEVRCHSYDNDVHITSITIAKRTTSSHPDGTRSNPAVGQSLNYWRRLNYDKTIVIEHGSDGTNRLVSRAAYDSDSGGKSRANIYVHWPYNYRTTTSASLSGNLITPGGTATATFNFGITRRTNPLVMSSGSYRTNTKSDMKLQGAIFYIPANVTKESVSEAIKASVNRPRTNTLCDAISNVSTNFLNCNVVSYDDSAHPNGKTYTGSNSADYSSSKAHNFIVPDVSNANIGVKICAVSGINYADSHSRPGAGFDSSLNDYTDTNRGKINYASNLYSNDAWTGSPTNNPNWRISNVVCQPLTVRPSFQVWNGAFYTNGSVATSTTTKYPPGKNITNGLPDRYTDSIEDARYYGSWAEYALLIKGTGTGITSGSRLGYPNGSNSNNYCNNSPMTIANRMAGLACVSNTSRNVGSSSIDADPSKFLAQIKTRYIDKRTDTNRTNFKTEKNEKDTKIVYYKGNTNLSNFITATSIKKFNRSNAATDDDNDTYVYVVNGTLTIDQNLCTASTNCSGDLKLTTRNSVSISSYGTIPQVIIVAKDINIKSNVTQVDAWLIASGDDPTGGTLNANGTVNTCSDYNSSNLNSGVCKNTIIFNGPVLAKSITLNRTNVQNDQAGNGVKVSTANLQTDFKSATAAEIFNLRPDTFLWAYYQATKYEYATTVYTKELAPRL